MNNFTSQPRRLGKKQFAIFRDDGLTFTRLFSELLDHA